MNSFKHILFSACIFLMCIEGFILRSTCVSSRPSRMLLKMSGGRKATPIGRTTTKAGKVASVCKVKKQINSTSLLFALPLETITFKQLSALRRSVPGEAKVMVVKNNIMKRALEGSMFEPLSNNKRMKGTNLWMFSTEEDMPVFVRKFIDWLKANKGLKLGDRVKIKMGMLNDVELTSEEVLNLKDVLTREEAMLRVCFNLKAIANQVARGVKLAYQDPDIRTSHSAQFSSSNEFSTQATPAT